MPVHLFDAPELLEASPGVFRTPEVPCDLPARSVVASWNAPLDQGPVPLEAALRVRTGGSWSPWVVVARREQAAGEPEPVPNPLRLEADELTSPAFPLEAAQLEVRLPPHASSPRRLGLCFWPGFPPLELPEEPVPPSVEQGRVRQHDLPGGEGHRLCGPSSLTMALRHFGVEVDPMEVAAAVHDPWARIYGNWSLLASYAGERGLASWVERGSGLRRVTDHLARGRLVLLSLRWGEYELPGAAVPSSDGHLVLAVGSDDEGLLVLDPAFRDPQIGIHRYDWQGLMRAWKSGAAIVVGRGP